MSHVVISPCIAPLCHGCREYKYQDGLTVCRNCQVNESLSKSAIYNISTLCRTDPLDFTQTGACLSDHVHR